jgi:hypothetical protein
LIETATPDVDECLVLQAAMYRLQTIKWQPQKLTASFMDISDKIL